MPEIYGTASDIRHRASGPMSYALIPAWQDDAACHAYNPDLWFPEWPKPNEYRLARRICKGCPVREQCAQYALDNGIRYGMFGGLTPGERQKIVDRAAERIPA